MTLSSQELLAIYLPCNTFLAAGCPGLPDDEAGARDLLTQVERALVPVRSWRGWLTVLGAVEGLDRAAPETIAQARAVALDKLASFEHDLAPLATLAAGHRGYRPDELEHLPLRPAEYPSDQAWMEAEAERNRQLGALAIDGHPHRKEARYLLSMLDMCFCKPLTKLVSVVRERVLAADGCREIDDRLSAIDHERNRLASRFLNERNGLLVEYQGKLDALAAADTPCP